MPVAAMTRLPATVGPADPDIKKTKPEVKVSQTTFVPRRALGGLDATSGGD
jgi:hypothetical protein